VVMISRKHSVFFIICILEVKAINGGRVSNLFNFYSTSILVRRQVIDTSIS
jgi:hypothetical protein